MGSRKVLSQYMTPVWMAEALIERHFPGLDTDDCVVEPSCGDGRFLQAIPMRVPAVGVEIDPLLAEQARERTGRRVIEGCFQTVELDVCPTAIIGNPPFDLRVVDAFLDHAHRLLPLGGRVGFILPAYTFQTAARLCGYNERWSITQKLIPRNVFPGLSLPLVFAMFAKDLKRTLVGFACYHEIAAIQRMPQDVREILERGRSRTSVWREALVKVLQALDGEAPLHSIYAALEGARPTSTSHWREKARQTLQRYHEDFINKDRGVWALADGLKSAA